MNPLLDFIRRGTVGELRLGLHRAQVEDKLGKPTSWLNKPPTFGPEVRTPEDADVWDYYDAARVRFDPQGIAVSVCILPKYINKEREPFCHWPIGPDLRMGELRELLVANRIDFDEGEDNEPGAYYILAEQRCTAYTIVRYDSGRLIPELKRPVSAIETVSRDEELPAFVLRYWRHISKDDPST